MLDPMAFFCPGTSHFGKHKKINGESRHHKRSGIKDKSLSNNNFLSLSPIPDLSRKQSFQRMVVIQEYIPKDSTGIAIHRGQTVELLSSDGEWMLVKTDRGEEGYVPCSHCAHPYNVSTRSDREGDVKSPFDPPRSKSFSCAHEDGALEAQIESRYRTASPNGLVNGLRSRVLSPSRCSPQLQRNGNNANNVAETGEPVKKTFNVMMTSGKRLSNQSSSSGNYDSGGDDVTSYSDHSEMQTTSADDSFSSNMLRTKMASESNLLAIRDNQPTHQQRKVHLYSQINDYSSKDPKVSPYSNPKDALAHGTDDVSLKLHSSSSDLLRQTREITPEWKPPLPSRTTTQGSQQLSSDSNTGSLKSISGSTDGGSSYTERASMDNLNKLQKFRKFIWGVYVMQQDFEAGDENEITVRAGHHVSLLNRDDPDWYWVVRHTDSQEGFVPKIFLSELMHVEQPYSAVTGKPIVSGIRQINSDSRVHRILATSPADGNASPPKFAKTPSSPATSNRSLPNGRRHHRQPDNFAVGAPSPVCTDTRDPPPSHGILKKFNKDRKNDNLVAKKDSPLPAAMPKVTSPTGSSTACSEGDTSHVGTLV